MRRKRIHEIDVRPFVVSVRERRWWRREPRPGSRRFLFELAILLVVSSQAASGADEFASVGWGGTVLRDGPIVRAAGPVQVEPHMRHLDWDRERGSVSPQEATAFVVTDDRVLHILAGASIALISATILPDVPVWTQVLLGMATGAVAGASKEAVDALGLGAVEVRDFWNTFEGAAVGAGVIAFVGAAIASEHGGGLMRLTLLQTGLTLMAPVLAYLLRASALAIRRTRVSRDARFASRRG